MKRNKVYQINDKTMKYGSMILTRHQHAYLKLPGTYWARYPQEIVFPNMSAGRVDEFYSTKEGLLINLEEESGKITEKIKQKISNYAIFGDYMYSKKVYSIILCHKDPKKPYDYFKRSPSIIIKIHYIYIPQDELWEKYENLINKIKQKQQLTTDETLDIAFVPKFISKEYGQYITETLAKEFKNAKISDEIKKMDIGVLLGAMILKHFEDEEKIDELLEEINMNEINDEIKIIVREEYGEELEKIENENIELQHKYAQMQKEHNQMKEKNSQMQKENTQMQKENTQMQKENIQMQKGIKQLSKMKDLSPEANEIINSLLSI